MTDQKLTRRTSLVRIGGVLATALGAAGIDARTSEGSGPAAVASGEVACVLAPEQTEGPYYIANETVRRNITEGRPGTPLLLEDEGCTQAAAKIARGRAVILPGLGHIDAFVQSQRVLQYALAFLDEVRTL